MEIIKELIEIVLIEENDFLKRLDLKGQLDFITFKFKEGKTFVKIKIKKDVREGDGDSYE